MKKLTPKSLGTATARRGLAIFLTETSLTASLKDLFSPFSLCSSLRQGFYRQAGPANFCFRSLRPKNFLAIKSNQSISIIL